MGIFTKRESTRVVRDEAGKATLITEKEPHGKEAMKGLFKRPVDRRKLTYEEQFPKEIQPAFVRQRRKESIIKAGKSVDAWIGRNLQPIGGYSTRTKRTFPSKRNLNPIGTMYDRGMKPTTKQRTHYVAIGGKAYPVASKKKKKSTKRRAGSGYDIMDNWGFMK